MLLGLFGTGYHAAFKKEALFVSRGDVVVRFARMV
jgi:hypothetical protein